MLEWMTHRLAMSWDDCNTMFSERFEETALDREKLQGGWRRIEF